MNKPTGANKGVFVGWLHHACSHIIVIGIHKRHKVNARKKMSCMCGSPWLLQQCECIRKAHIKAALDEFFTTDISDIIISYCTFRISSFCVYRKRKYEVQNDKCDSDHKMIEDFVHHLTYDAASTLHQDNIRVYTGDSLLRFKFDTFARVSFDPDTNYYDETRHTIWLDSL